MATISTEVRSPRDGDLPAIRADETRVRHLQNTVQSIMNPWTVTSESLLSLSSGRVASAELEKDLLGAEQFGGKAADDFIQQRLLSNSKQIDESIKQQKLKTFASKPKPTTKAQEKASVVKSDRLVFARLLAVMSTRTVDLKMVLSYSLSPVSLPLASSSGHMCKTAKSALLNELEKICVPALELPDTTRLGDTALIIDAMALIQALPSKKIPKTFSQLAHLVLDRISSHATEHRSTRVDFVGDCYLSASIKDLERTRRGQADTTRIMINSPEQKVPEQWNKYLRCGANKEDLLTFLAQHWQHAVLNHHLNLYVTDRQKCYYLNFQPATRPTVSTIHNLQSDHEEADTRLIVHGIHAAADYDHVIIKSPDTDVAVLCIGHVQQFRTLYFKTPTRPLVNITKMAVSA